MATDPSFAATPRFAGGSVSTANTNRDGTGTIATILTAGSSGTRIERIVVHATGDPADSIVTIFIHDGTNYWIVDEFDLGNPAAASATQMAAHAEKAFDFTIPTGHSIRAAITAAPTAGAAHVTVYGADL